jgi:flagellar assembly protein FliH
MTWRETISFSQPLRDARLLTGAAPQDWEELARQREQAAYLRGRNESERAMSEQLVQQRTEIAELQKGILESLRRAVPQVIQETEGVLLALALEAARKVVAGLPVSPEMIEAVVREALRQVEDTAEITIQLHHDDLALLHKHGAAILDGAPETGPLRFVGSDTLTRGGCTVQTRFGLIDATRETKLEQLHQAIHA